MLYFYKKQNKTLICDKEIVNCSRKIDKINPQGDNDLKSSFWNQEKYFGIETIVNKVLDEKEKLIN